MKELLERATTYAANQELARGNNEASDIINELLEHIYSTVPARLMRKPGALLTSLVVMTPLGKEHSPDYTGACITSAVNEEHLDEVEKKLRARWRKLQKSGDWFARTDWDAR